MPHLLAKSCLSIGLAAAGVSMPLTARADPGAWTFSAGLQDGSPSGWVQVRENDIAGSRLGFRGDLGVSRIPSEDLTLHYDAGDGGYWEFRLRNYSVEGTAVPGSEVYFNGSTLEAGRPLSADTRFPDYLQFSAVAGRRLASFGDGGVLSGELGLDYTALNFRLAGTVTATSAGQETKEDFVTQELPVPIAGLGLSRPLGAGWRFVSGLRLGYLPWSDSLRHEGGVVRLTQAEAELRGGLRCDFTPHASVSGQLFYSYFSQHEQSGEDDNDILLEVRGVRVEFAYRF